MTSSTEAAVAPPAHLVRQARGQVMGLVTQFLVGMAVNLIGLPSEVKGRSKTATNVFLTLHILIAAGLVVGAVQVLRFARTSDRRSRRLATYGAVAIAATVVAGMSTLATKSNWWSYVMAVGFATSLLVYGAILLPRDEHT